MKRFAFLLVPLSFLAPLHAEDLAPANPPAETDTYIPASLEVPAFVPPPPVEPKVPLTDAEATIVVRDEKGETTTLQRGQASMAPDLPEPQPAPETPPTPPAIPIHRPVTISMGGTIYNHAVSVVHWQHPISKEDYEAVLGFDLSLLSPIPSFIRDGVPHHATLLFSNTSTTGPLANKLAALGRPIIAPEIAPDAYRITKGDPSDTAGLAPLIALRDLYLAEKPRLEKLRTDLADYRADEKAWADAHPAPPEPPVFWFKPHRNSRYLTEQDKADQQQAAEDRAQQQGEQP